MVTQTIQFESISLSEVGSGAITAFLYDDATLAGTLASIAENGTLAGRYTGTVEDVAAGTYRLVVKVNDITVNDADEMVDLLLAVGTYVAYQHAALDSAALRAAMGLAAADLDTQLAAILAAGSGSGSGARTISITVTDGTDPLENATVRLTEGAATFAVQTDVNGEATFNIDDATYVVSITKAGHSFAGASLVVVGNATIVYAMDVITLPPSGDPATTTGYAVLYDPAAVIEPGALLTVRLKTPPVGVGVVADTEARVIAAGVDGTVVIPGLYKGGTYYFYRGKKTTTEYLVPADAGDTWQLPNLAGADV